MLYVIRLVFVFLFSWPAMAIDIGPMTVVMEPSQSFVSRTVTNNSTAPKIYEIRANKISNPTANGQQLDMKRGELLYSPKRFVLHSKQVQNVKFYYRGDVDDHERYYQVIFTESPTAQTDESEKNIRRGALEIKLELQSILVVRPRKMQFNYQLDKGSSAIKNTGNTFFEFMVKDGCEQPDGKADSKYLLPGDIYHNVKVSESGNQKVIVFQSRFIPVGNDCW
ncbi:fimbria/pilus periplasmic chaperone [Aeromonas popoffii]|uniref:fimbria/pilus periplasmic chaperone n=1 Tax=Aeromonas popoffii TaxID=70856 RepID=UPI0030D552A7